MKLAIICPNDYIASSLRLSFHFLLAQRVCESTLLMDVYRNRNLRGDFIIVDNGAAEGELSPDALVEVATYVHADEVILPDVLRDCDQTLSKSLERKILKVVAPTRRMVVPQGANWQEWTYCLDQLIAKATPSTIGVAKWLNELPGGRKEALRIIWSKKYHLHHRIHLLGCARAFKEEMAELNIPWVRSMDTALPVAMAQRGMAGIRNIPTRTSLEWDKGYDSRLAERNVIDALDMSQEVKPCTFQ